MHLIIVTKTYWFEHFFKWSWWALRYRKSMGRAFTFLNYKNFFDNKNAFHLEKKIVPNKEIDLKSTSISQIISKYQIDTKKTLLKVDIDMDEYKIFDEILEQNFLGLIIEFSYVDKMLDEVLNFVKKNTNMSIIHIHGNNFDSPDDQGNPIHLEITFLKNELLDNDEKLESLKSLPLKDLDYPNNVMKDEIPIKFFDN